MDEQPQVEQVGQEEQFGGVSQQVEAQNLTLNNGFALGATVKEDMTMDSSIAFGAAVGGSLTASDSVLFSSAVGGDLSLTDSATFALSARGSAQLQESGSGVTLANEVHVQNGTLGVVIARKVYLSGDSKIVLDSKQAAVFAAVFAAIFSVLTWLLRRSR